MENCSYLGSCVDNPFGTVEELVSVIDNAREITKQTFMRHCRNQICTDETLLMNQFPQSYTYHKSKWDHALIYFYEWSRIEFFFKIER